MRDDTGVFVMSYGRKDVLPTVTSLMASNYTGAWWVVIGNDDPQIDCYKAQFGSRCIVFDKAAYVAKTDRMGLKITKAICFARNACYDIAESLGLSYFQQLDDDYGYFAYSFTDQLVYLNKMHRVRSYDTLLTNLVECLERLPPLCKAVAFAQGGDFLGGGHADLVQPGGKFWTLSRLRKAMNSWVCATDRRIVFQGCMNEDVSAYTSLQFQGGLCLNTMQCRLNQPVTQTTGGMASVYREYGTHVKSFMTVMLNPSFCKIGRLVNQEQRLHHAINWGHCAPKIIRAHHKKGE